MAIAAILLALMQASAAKLDGKIIHIDETGRAAASVDECGPRRDFGGISARARARVIHYWRFVAQANAERILGVRAQFNTDSNALTASQRYSPGTETAAAYSARTQGEVYALRSRLIADIRSIDDETMRARAVLVATLSPADRAVFAEITLPQICSR